MSRLSQKRRKFNLWQQDSRCYWCGCETLLIYRPPTICNKKFPKLDNEATLDHLYSAINGPRPVEDYTCVLACNSCNHKRGQETEQAVGLDELHKRAGGHNDVCTKETLI